MKCLISEAFIRDVMITVILVTCMFSNANCFLAACMVSLSFILFLLLFVFLFGGNISFAGVFYCKSYLEVLVVGSNVSPFPSFKLI